MTENEAKQRIRYRIDIASEIAGKGVDGKAFEDLELAIQALEENQKYHAIGTAEEFKSLKEKSEPRNPYKGRFGVIRCSCCDEQVGQMVTEVLIENKMNFCSYCGHKVLWNKEIERSNDGKN